ncbi:MAG: hypothetical protein QNJ97_20395 [Myxococcota bacterium]|nr:hypothetical protein [Myxococcota bacterium]
MKKILILLLSASLVSISASELFAASTAHTYGFSAKGIAMGNAMSAVVEDWSSLFYNMAGLGKTAHLKGGDPSFPYRLVKEKGEGDDDDFFPNQLALGYLYTLPQFSIDINRVDPNTGSPRPTKGADDLNYGSIVLGIVADLNILYKLPTAISSARFGFGLMSNDDGSVVKINDLSPRTHNFMRYGREAQRAVLQAGIGLGFLEDAFGIGLGAHLSFVGKGKVKITEVDISAEEQTPEGESRMDMSMDPSFLGGVYVRPGKLIGIKNLETLELAFAYRQWSELNIYPFDTFAVATGNIPLEMVLALYDYYTPETFIFGISYSISGLSLSLEGEYQRWSKFKVSSANFINFPNIPQMESIIMSKFGISYNVITNLTAIAGYYYQPSYVPKAARTGPYNFLDNNKHVGSVGIQYIISRLGNLGGALELNASYQFQYLVPERVTKDDQTNTLDPDYEYGGNAHTMMANITFRI